MGQQATAAELIISRTIGKPTDTSASMTISRVITALRLLLPLPMSPASGSFQVTGMTFDTVRTQKWKS